MPPADTLPATPAQARLDEALADYLAANRARRLFIATDKPLYQPGEAIWFRAFDLFARDLKGDAQQRGATFELISPKGAAVLAKRVLVQAGAAHNDFIIPQGVPGGEYKLRMVTDDGVEIDKPVIVSTYQPPRIKKKLEFLRKAYGPGDQVAAAIALERGTGEPLASTAATGLVVLDGAELARVPITTDAAGKAVVRFPLPAQIARGDGLLTVLVDDGGVTESIQKRIPITLDKVQLALFPEGGDLVVGLPGRVYFAARNPLDKPADIEGRVIDDRGAPVALFRSYHNGMGRFELTPAPGRSYKVEITRPVGIAQTFDVPPALPAGCSMQSVDDFGSERGDIRVAVWCSSDITVVATAVLREHQLGAASARLAAYQPSVISLPAPASAQGAVRVTVFGGDLAPLAERLIYRNRGRNLKVEITADKASYNPRGRVALTVKTRDPSGAPVQASVALAVVDDTVLSFADDKTAHLTARLLLESEMPGQEIEEPNFYFSDDPKAPAGIDLVLGTQGWRRFDWEPVLRPREPIAVGWEYTGQYWQDEQGQRPEPEKPEEDLEPEPEDVNAAEDDDRGGGARRARRQVAARGPARQPQRVADRPDMPAAAPMPAQAGMALAAEVDELLLIEGRAAGGAFGVGGDIDENKRRIRDKDWAGADEKNMHWGWAAARQFPVPNYEARYDGPRVDFRETVYWQPDVRTDAGGEATVAFYLSDAVTSFRAVAEGVSDGGLPGRGEAVIASKLPVSLAVSLPLEVSAGDRVRLPVTITNETGEPYTAALTADFGPAFARAVAGGSAHGPDVRASVTLAPRERKSLFYDLAVVGGGRDEAAGMVRIAVEAANLRDEVERTIRVVPLGFPQEVSASGTVNGGEAPARHVFDLGEALPGTLEAKVTLYPSPLATMVEGTQAILREPTGCFEQASSANYPNIMVLSYLEQSGAAEPELVERTTGMLERGYALLTGYESPNKGYEWFGGDPGHEALTAYGLMEFVDMTGVWGDVDRDMIERTARWLKQRRDGAGGYKRNDRALDSFGRASDEVTAAYITYALTEARQGGIERELDRQARLARDTADPYVLALAAGALVNARPRSADARAAIAKLAAAQAEDGSFPGADHSITRSGGIALAIETTALGAMALMKGNGDRERVRRAIEWLNANRDGFGGYGSTQSTVLALKALTAYADYARATEAAGVVSVRINGAAAGEIAYEKGHQGAIEIDLSDRLRPGRNIVEVKLASEAALPYSVLVTYRTTEPPASARAAVALTTRLDRRRVPMGETARMTARVENRRDSGIPMVLARVGLPGGLTFQTWQLKELVDKKLIDFYETREREVILYFRSMAPRAVKTIDLDLKAQVPGEYVAPASSAYLYYTDEHKHWAPPVRAQIIQR